MKQRARSIASEALRIAQKGTPIFPCNHLKRPLVDGGFKAATTDLKQINRWWGQYPDALIGMPTGKDTGCTVVDVDSGKATSDDPKYRAEGEAALKWEAENKSALTGAMVVATQSGGRHYYVQYDGRGSTQGARGGLHKGVDTRSDGGYVIIPPSPGYTILKQAGKDTWPVSPSGSLGGSILGIKRKGMDLGTMQLGPEAEEQLVDVLRCLYGEPDEYHNNLQRLAYVLSMWFDRPLDQVEPFLSAITKAAAKDHKIDQALYHKHMRLIPRMARHYAAIRLSEREEQIAEQIDNHHAQITVQSIIGATPKELDQLSDLIEQRRAALKEKKRA